jgi:hypothetical protein
MATRREAGPKAQFRAIATRRSGAIEALLYWRTGMEYFVLRIQHSGGRLMHFHEKTCDWDNDNRDRYTWGSYRRKGVPLGAHSNS